MGKDTSGNLDQPLLELFRPGYKVWVERGGTHFGDGLYYLLVNIKQYGSISRAAREMSMSYRAAWGKIKAAERDCGFQLVTTQVGGDAGGGAKLTGKGMQLLDSYGRFRQEINQTVERVFRESFTL